MKDYDHLCCDEHGIKEEIYNRFSSKAEIWMSIKKLTKCKVKDKKKKR